jgi:hypothetical protein
MIANLWNRVLDWFEDRRDRTMLVRSFNKAAKDAYISGMVPTLLKASVSNGDRTYQHQYSHWFYSGFRIVAFSGQQLSRGELKDIGLTVLQNPQLSRQLVVLGFDTLEIQPNVGSFGLKWALRNHIMIG